MPRRVSNPDNPWASTHVEWLEEPPRADLEVYEEEAKSILSRNESPDVPFHWSVNPYRGCFHGCAYCYARPTHQYLGFGAGTDFDRKIVVKTNTPERLAESFAKRNWKRELVSFSGNTDCYQPLEVTYELTRRSLAVCADFHNPVSIITKSPLIRRDVDLLDKVASRAPLRAYLSIPFADAEMARAIEPYAAPPAKRFEAIRALADAGLHVGVSVSPIVPGLNDAQVAEILERAAEAGAQSAFYILLRLPGETGPVFWQRLEETYPDRVRKVRSALTESRGGKENESRFGVRMSGKGPRWSVIEQLFHSTCRRLGLEAGEWFGDARPNEPRETQRELF